MRALALTFALLAVTACATPQAAEAQPTTAPAQAAAPASTEVLQLTLDPVHTQVAFSIDRFGYNHVLGRFDAIAGNVTLDQGAPERSTVTATIQTASISTGNPTRNEHLSAARWLDVATYPTMEFRSTSVRRTGAQSAEVTGDLTLHGQTHPVTLTVSLNQVGRSPSNGKLVAGFSATGLVRRSEFGMTTAANLIGDDVRITIEVLGETNAPPAQ